MLWQVKTIYTEEEAMETDRRSFLKAAALGILGLAGRILSSCSLTSGPFEGLAAKQGSLHDYLLDTGAANYSWRYQGREVSGTVVSKDDPHEIDLVIQVNGRDISVPVDRYQLKPGDRITAYPYP